MTSEEALELLKDKRMEINYKVNGTTQFSEAIYRAIKALEREPKTGHWINHREHCENLGVKPSGLGAYEWCSNCDCGIDVTEFHRNHYNFCPNCGAEMMEVEE